MKNIEYLLLEKKRFDYKFIDSGDLAKLYRKWLENAVDRIIVKVIEVETKEKE